MVPSELPLFQVSRYLAAGMESVISGRNLQTRPSFVCPGCMRSLHDLHDIFNGQAQCKIATQAVVVERHRGQSTSTIRFRRLGWIARAFALPVQIISREIGSGPGRQIDSHPGPAAATSAIPQSGAYDCLLQREGGGFVLRFARNGPADLTTSRLTGWLVTRSPAKRVFEFGLS